MSLASSVLLVDDDPAMLALVESVVRDAGLNVVSARSAEEALRLCESEAPRAAIVDGLLPGMRGDELCKRLRSRWPKDVLPLAFLSAFFRDLKSYGYLTRECGVDVVLHKPIEQHELRSALGQLPGLATDADPDALDGGMNEDLAQLLADYLQSAKDKVLAMRAGLERLGGPDEPATLDALRTEAHRFRGSGASFGIPEVSRLGGEIEDLLRAGPLPLPAAARGRLEGLVEALGDALLRATGIAPIHVRADEAGSPKLLLVDGASEIPASAATAAAAGRALRVFSDPEAAFESARADAPAVPVVGMDRPALAGGAAGRKLLGAAVGRVALVVGAMPLEERVATVRAGIAGHVPRPADAEGLFRFARELARPKRGARILALDDDRISLAILAETLAPHDVDVEPCRSPEELFEALERSSPSLVVLDVVVPRFSGLELLRTIRADPIHGVLPAVVVSSQAEQKDRLAAFDAGADDFVAKPFHTEELAARILVHLARHHREQRALLHDRLTGAFRRPALVDAAERGIALARRSGRPLAVLVFDWDADQARRAHGRLVADAVTAALGAQLEAAFRRSDLVARIGEGRFAVLLHDATAADAHRLLAAELDAFRGRTFPGGLAPAVRGAAAPFPEIGGGATALLEAAERQVPLLLR